MMPFVFVEQKEMRAAFYAVTRTALIKGSTLPVSLSPLWQCQRPGTALTVADFLSLREDGAPGSHHDLLLYQIKQL